MFSSSVSALGLYWASSESLLNKSVNEYMNQLVSAGLSLNVERPSGPGVGSSSRRARQVELFIFILRACTPGLSASLCKDTPATRLLP